MEQIEGTLSVTTGKKGKIFKARFTGKKGTAEQSIFPQVMYCSPDDAVDGAPIIIERDAGQIKKVTIKGKPECAPGLGGASGQGAGQPGQSAQAGHGGQAGYQKRPYDNRNAGSGYQNRSYDNRSYDNRNAGGAGGYQNRSYDNRNTGAGYQNRSYDNRNAGGVGGYQNRPYDNRNAGYQNRPQGARPDIPPATAPYNFIEQNCVLEAPGLTGEERYSGTLVLQLRTLTPMLIGSGLARNRDPESVVRRQCMKVDDSYVIPGSSLKGLLRSTVEILSCSGMRAVKNTRVFTRNFNDSRYREKFGIGQQHSPQQAGYLVRNGADFEIIPVPYTPVRIGTAPTQGRLRVCTGQIARKNHDYDFELYQAHAKDRGIPVPDAFIDDFILQLTPAQEMMLRKYRIDGADGVKRMTTQLPVFFLARNGVLEAFGLAKYFRCPSRFTIHELRDNTMQPLPEGRLDLAMQLFGYVEGRNSLCGRVNVSAAFFDPGTKVSALPPRQFSSPHASCYAHYLEQDVSRMRCMPRNPSQWDVNSMNTFNDPSRLRGRKCYWHRDVEIPPVNPRNTKYQNVLEPVNPDSRAEFTVTVNQVSLVELGAILEALLLPEGHAHKLGLDKSSGLGSVRLSLTRSEIASSRALYSDIEKRCLGVLAGTAPEAPEDQDALLSRARKAFQDWLLGALQQKGQTYSDYGNIPHVRSFLHMTDYEHRPANAKTRYMELREFRALRVLGKSTEVV